MSRDDLAYAFRDPEIEPAPLGETLILLTENGTIIIGKWEKEGYVGWARRPLVPKSLSERVIGGRSWKSKASA